MRTLPTASSRRMRSWDMSARPSTTRTTTNSSRSMSTTWRETRCGRTVYASSSSHGRARRCLACTSRTVAATCSTRWFSITRMRVTFKGDARNVKSNWRKRSPRSPSAPRTPRQYAQSLRTIHVCAPRGEPSLFTVGCASLLRAQVQSKSTQHTQPVHSNAKTRHRHGLIVRGECLAEAVSILVSSCDGVPAVSSRVSALPDSDITVYLQTALVS
mmetsp:Transcript_40933/g.108203  ORF Transcript_40933/g.108203 Transcript_40933/m.108203 type:complete len:215 (-) Transcript_40933:143-787(-)